MEDRRGGSDFDELPICIPMRDRRGGFASTRFVDVRAGRFFVLRTLCTWWRLHANLHRFRVVCIQFDGTAAPLPLPLPLPLLLHLVLRLRLLQLVQFLISTN